MRSQKEVTLAEDLELRDRSDIYRNFLLYCMSGDVVALPMGTTVVVERDSSEFARLAQLGDVLGLSQFDVSSVRSRALILSVFYGLLSRVVFVLKKTYLSFLPVRS